MDELLKVRNLKVSYQTNAGTVYSVRGVSFDIKEGKTTAIVGESGCGKSVTAKSVMGLIHKPGKIEEGSTIEFKGNNILKNSDKEWNEFRGKECSMIFQDALVSLNPTIKIGRQIEENLKNHYKDLSKQDRKEKVLQILKRVGIPDAEQNLDKYPHELSGGMRQRVMIAMGLVTNPGILIADEPTTALDVTIQAQIMELMKDLQKKENMSILLITHDLGVVADVADEIIVMYAGKIVEKGKCEDVFYHAGHPYTVALLNSVPKIGKIKKKKLETIEGSVPDMTRPVKGCAFSSRCPYAMNICERCEPDTKEMEKGHEVACWLHDERANIEDIAFLMRGSQND